MIDRNVVGLSNFNAQSDAVAPSVSSPAHSEPRDFTEVLTPELCLNIFRFVDLKSKVRAEVVSKNWRRLITESYSMDTWSAWLYVIFREGHVSGHDRVTVKISQDGPIFWNQSIVYVYMCSCHVYERHEPQWTSLFRRVGCHVRRLCLVTSPARSAFLTNDFYLFCLDTFPKLEILYLRELNLETIATSTVEKLASSETLRRVIVHKCVCSDTLTDFHRLNDRLMIVHGDLRGLEDLLKSKDAYPEDLEPLFNGLVANAEIELNNKAAVAE
ncbi:F-box domain protein [Trichuris suis]|nr:F-box domain protein [Trichuris suis]